MAADEITRVRYFERQFLRAVDFRDEQTYDRDARRRHALAQHTWGIVTGLELVETEIASDPGFVDVVLQPGVAIDGFGRELVCYDPVRLDAALFDAFHTAASKQEVWIGYHEEESGAAQSGWADCQDTAATRITESWRLFVAPPEPPIDPIIVDGVAAGSALPGASALPADTSVPYQELPQASPGDRWLILLGVVTWDGTEQRFRPTPPASTAADKRRYAGAVADHLLAPSHELAIRRRRAAPEIDAAEFATVEGRLRVQGRVNAEKDVWIEGGKVRFTYEQGAEEKVPLTLGRERPANDETGHELRLQLGDPKGAEASLSIGAGDTKDASDVARVSSDDTVDIPTGTLRFGKRTRQMLDLYKSTDKLRVGIGVQDNALYFRSESEFCWFKGGKHDDAALSPGAGGDLQLRLDDNADLHFGSRVRQMLNLWDTRYGIGVQAWTLYFRTHGDFCWFRDGDHNDQRANAGGGKLAMRLDSNDHLWLRGSLTTQGNTHVVGKLQVEDEIRGAGDLLVAGHAPSVIKVRSYEHVQKNAETGGQSSDAGAPSQWTRDVGSDFDEIFDAFVVLNGFSIFPQNDPKFGNSNHQFVSANYIVQHAYVRIVERQGTTITLESYCQQSDAESSEEVNCTLSILVVLGRTNP